tara:strand:- start:569 stop:874 length:306 start_codon:yes stop_codon:yes gene_type:complete
MSNVKEAYTEVFNSDGTGLTTQVVVRSVYPKLESYRFHGWDRIDAETEGRSQIQDGRMTRFNQDQLIAGDEIYKLTEGGGKILVGASARTIRLNAEKRWET